MSAVVLTSLSSAREKAQKAAFKAEVSGLHPSALSYCDGKTNNTGFVFTAGSRIAAGNVLCSNSGSINSLVITPSPAITGCTNATLTETGVTFGNCD